MLFFISVIINFCWLGCSFEDDVGSILRWDTIYVFRPAANRVSSSLGLEHLSNNSDVDGLHHAKALVVGTSWCSSGSCISQTDVWDGGTVFVERGGVTTSDIGFGIMWCGWSFRMPGLVKQIRIWIGCVRLHILNHILPYKVKSRWNLRFHHVSLCMSCHFWFWRDLYVLVLLFLLSLIWYSKRSGICYIFWYGTYKFVCLLIDILFKAFSIW